MISLTPMNTRGYMTKTGHSKVISTGLLLQAFHVNGLTTAAIFNIQYIEYTDYPSSAVYIVILWDDVYHARPRTLWTVDQANDPALFPVLNPNPDYLERQRKMSYTTDDNPPLNIVYS